MKPPEVYMIHYYCQGESRINYAVWQFLYVNLGALLDRGATNVVVTRVDCHYLMG